MKKKEKYRIINYAVKDFNESFEHDVKPQKYSRKYIDKLFREYPYWSMVDASYCCYGWEEACWQDLIEEGIWSFTNETARNSIRRIIEQCDKYLRRDQRLFVQKNEDDTIAIFITCRDTPLQRDLRITGSKISFDELYERNNITTDEDEFDDDDDYDGFYYETDDN